MNENLDQSAEAKQHRGEKPSAAPETTVQARGRADVAVGLRSLQQVSDPDGQREETAQEKPDEVPSLRRQLEQIVKLQLTLYQNCPAEKRNEIWTAYRAVINTFRKAAFDLPPFEECMPTQKTAIGDAMGRADAATLWKLFTQERQKRDKPAFWKRIPGVNFLAGIIGGAVELGSGVATLADEGAKALGVAASEYEKQQAKNVLAAVAGALRHPLELARGFMRTEEYEEALSVDAGETTGYVLGKHYFDLATVVIGQGIAQGTGRAAAKTAGRAAAEAAARTTMEVAERTATAGIRRATAETARKGVKVAARAGKKAGEEGSKETGKELFKHTEKAGEDEKTAARAQTISLAQRRKKEKPT